MYTKDNQGNVVKTKSTTSNVYIKENGILRIVESNEQPTIADLQNLIAEVQKDIKKTYKAIDDYDPTIAVATKQELKRRTHIAEKSLVEANRMISILSSTTKVASGGYFMAIGTVLRQGLYIIGTTGTTVISSPILGTTIMAGGAVLTTVGLYELYITLSEEQ